MYAAIYTYTWYDIMHNAYNKPVVCTELNYTHRAFPNCPERIVRAGCAIPAISIRNAPRLDHER